MLMSYLLLIGWATNFAQVTFLGEIRFWGENMTMGDMFSEELTLSDFTIFVKMSFWSFWTDFSTNEPNTRERF